MFLAVCKNNLFSCVRGHVPTLNCSNIAVTKWPKLFKGASAEWCQKARTDLNWHHRLKQKVCSLGQWWRLAHNDRLHDRKSTFNGEGISDHCQGHSWPVSFTPLPKNQESCLALKTRTRNLTSLTLRSKPPVCNYNLQLFDSTRVFNARVPLANLPVHSGARGFCCPRPKKPILDEELSSSQQDSRESASCQQDAKPPAPHHEHFQFKELYENPWTIPNFLCMARIMLAPVLGYLIVERYFHISLGLFMLAGATDLLDGWIARNWPSQKSALGSALDPLADKILISVLYVSLTYANLIPAPLTALVISRDIALIAAVFYVRYKTVPPPVTLSKFFNPCYTTAQLKPTFISKVNTAIQLLLVAASVASPVFHYTDSLLLQSLWYITALTTVSSSYSYYHYGRKTVKILNRTK
ncbi:cardiolipin synthase (CMP-forming) [Alosa pseudoharengus]|uniref:cardiolipin synthase (CMP-forming) n=1 Tax=Alosa pseudoharengus TaxID=34774 RepID=UPI003F8BBAEF